MPGIIDSSGSDRLVATTPQGSEKASMPMKCIDQMPPPMLMAPALVQAQRARGDAAATMRPEIESATSAARIAIATEVATSHGS